MVQKAQRGSAAAMTRLLRRHYRQLYTVAWAYVRNEQDALDVIQEASYRAVVRVAQLQDPALFGTWLTRIVINEATRLLAERKRREAAPLTETVPAAIATDAAQHLAVTEALGSIDERYATVLRLHYLGGWSVHDVAGQLAVSENTVKTRLARGRAALREALGRD
nr:sigma-70 family RNA polymerase sigma factor [Lacticaseibacillus kribbianus]